MNFIQRLIPARWRRGVAVVPVVRLAGAIGAVTPLRPGLSLAGVAKLLDRAFGMRNAKAIAVVINSPGGSPVQSRLIFQRIRDLAVEKNKPVLVFVEDVAASGGYMIALAGDEIFADPTSIVGSIGVVSGGFGFPEMLKKIGVERRVYTAGSNKAILDPFQPERESDVEYLKSLQVEIHQVFIDMVKARRGTRLADDPDLFSGLFWTGGRGRALGLVDGLSDMRSELKRRYGPKTRLELVSTPKGLFGRKTPGVGGLSLDMADRIGSAGVSAVAELAEEKALWGRFGLSG